ncbi:unnamed protein product [Blepharisma stoltei]|uniref:Glutathione S-transferase n=1 Tax=Blepharisma stoltei TaxID=1481888 RepID=A0AAU9J678_9CILI|nr:unnamed protein product [Blepharisma stoltei]
MSDIVVHYFDLYGRAEVIRILLHYVGVPFTDHRVQFSEWPEVKVSGLAEFGQLPVVDIDGLRLAQTRSIVRYLCQKYNLYTSNPQDIYWIESLCDLIDDMQMYIANFFWTKDEEGLKKTFSDKIPDWLQKIEARLERNNAGQGFFVGDHPTNADFFVFSFLYNYILVESPDIFDLNAPKVKQWMTRLIESSQSLKTYLETRVPSSYYYKG